jgi:hypothetical protein
MQITRPDGIQELTQHASAADAVRHLAQRLVDLEGNVTEAKLVTVGGEVEQGGRRYRLTDAGWRRVGGSGGLYELARSDLAILGL